MSLKITLRETKERWEEDLAMMVKTIYSNCFFLGKLPSALLTNEDKQRNGQILLHESVAQPSNRPFDFLVGACLLKHKRWREVLNGSWDNFFNTFLNWPRWMSPTRCVGFRRRTTPEAALPWHLHKKNQLEIFCSTLFYFYHCQKANLEYSPFQPFL